MSQSKDLQEILDHIHSPAFIVRDGVISAVNQAAAQHFAEVGTVISEILETGQEEYANFRSGSLYLSLRLTGTVYHCTITQLQEQQLFQLDEDIAHRDLQVLALASQQLCMPVSELSLILNRLPDIPQEEKAKLNQSIYKLQRILGNMADTEQYTTVSPAMVTQEICSLAEEVFEKSKTMLESIGVTLHYTLPNQPIFSLAEPEMLKRALYNMISNGVKFSSAGSRLEAVLTRSGNKIYITVTNTAESDSLPGGSIFRRYQRTPGLENSKFGLGLGMSLIHGVAAAHGGAVFLESNQKQGVKITMSLKIQKASGTAVRSPVLKPDIYGGHDQALIELSDILPYHLYEF